MPPATIFFTGAPLACDLVEEGGSDKLLDSFSSSIAQFAGLQAAGPGDEAGAPEGPSLTAAQPYAAWHSLPLKGEHLATGFSQVRGWMEEYRGNVAYYAAEDPTFLSTEGETSLRSSGDRSTQAALEDVTSQFYEHSLALHDDLPTSQIAPAASASQSEEESGYSTSFHTTHLQSTAEEDSVISTSAKKPIPNAGQITNLDRLPNEAYLTSIGPQTMSITIICGIISISAPRIITTRHGSSVSLIEMLVGDDHKSGFGINFWLPPSKTSSALRDALSGLRPQDIILVRNMALSSFKGKVYGQSLRREMTKVDLLYRKRVDRTDRAGCYGVRDLSGEVESQMHSQILKTKRVRDWVLRFVGGGPAVGGSGDAVGMGGLRKRADGAGLLGEMPPDTQ